jgi:hypothetical protein
VFFAGQFNSAEVRLILNLFKNRGERGGGVGGGLFLGSKISLGFWVCLGDLIFLFF